MGTCSVPCLLFWSEGWEIAYPARHVSGGEEIVARPWDFGEVQRRPLSPRTEWGWRARAKHRLKPCVFFFQKYLWHSKLKIDLIFMEKLPVIFLKFAMLDGRMARSCRGDLMWFVTRTTVYRCGSFNIGTVGATIWFEVIVVIVISWVVQQTPGKIPQLVSSTARFSTKHPFRKGFDQQISNLSRAENVGLWSQWLLMPSTCFPFRA